MLPHTQVCMLKNMGNIWIHGMRLFPHTHTCTAYNKRPKLCTVFHYTSDNRSPPCSFSKTAWWYQIDQRNLWFSWYVHSKESPYGIECHGTALPYFKENHATLLYLGLYMYEIMHTVHSGDVFPCKYVQETTINQRQSFTIQVIMIAINVLLQSCDTIEECT